MGCTDLPPHWAADGCGEKEEPKLCPIWLVRTRGVAGVGQGEGQGGMTWDSFGLKSG